MIFMVLKIHNHVNFSHITPYEILTSSLCQSDTWPCPDFRDQWSCHGSVFIVKTIIRPCSNAISNRLTWFWCMKQLWCLNLFIFQRCAFCLNNFKIIKKKIDRTLHINYLGLWKRLNRNSVNGCNFRCFFFVHLKDNKSDRCVTVS